MTPDSVAVRNLTSDTPSLMRDYFSLTKPRLSSLVIFTCFLGMYLAPGVIHPVSPIISLIATSALVGGACAINCWMERDIDALMERTKDRPIPSGRISANSAFMFGVSLCAIALLALYFFVNPLTATLGFIAGVTYVLLYTPLKTRSSWALFAGAIPGAIPPLMGWTTVTNAINPLGVVLFSILFVWQIPHFLSIAIYHVKDYDRADIKTHPGNIGIHRTVFRIGFYTYALFLISLAPFYISAATETYKYAIMAMGGMYFLYSLWGHTYEEGSKELLIWARRYFYLSLIYLPCVFLLIIIFRENFYILS